MHPAKFARRLVYAVGCGLLAAHGASAQLRITYGPAGLQQLSYNGTTLEDSDKFSADSFHIWHLKVTDLAGTVLTGPPDGWGENSQRKTWDPGSLTWTYLFGWGSIQCQYVQTGDTLNLVITETNRSNSGVVLDGAAIYPLALHFPALPANFLNSAYPQVTFNTTGPSATLANYGTAELAAVVADANKPLYSGFWPSGSGSPTYSVLVSSTTPDGLATFQPHNDRPVQPGQTDTFTVSLRFAGPDVALSTLAADAYASWGKTWPQQLKWKDKRVIGTAYLASSPQYSTDVSQPGGFPNNPRRFFNNSDPNEMDVRNVAGVAQFQALVLQRAKDVVTNLQRLNAQGVITWDIEGEEYPQATSYVCSPDQIATAAPEMESVITDTRSGYRGQKLDDAYFGIIRDAGYRVGVCVRPQHFTKIANGTAQQAYLLNTAVEQEMRTKIQYAHDRWGATLFYIDSTVEQDGSVLDAAIFQRLAASFPDSLLIPEETVPKHYAYTAPFKTFLFHGDLGTDSVLYSYYPSAFSCTLINDVDPTRLGAAVPALIQAVVAGDILMAHADYWDQNNPAIVAIYQAAAASATYTAPVGPAPTTTTSTNPEPPAPTTPPASTASPAPSIPATTSEVMIQSPAFAANVSGTIQVIASVTANLDAAGSYLTVDGVETGTARLTSAPFSYRLDTTTLTEGTHLLQIWAHSTSNEVLLSDPVSIQVSTATAVPTTGTTTSPLNPTPSNPLPAGPLAITFPISGQALSGNVHVAASIASQLDAAGSYLMVDGQPYGFQRVTSMPYLYQLDTSSLASGTHVLQIWAHTTGNETLLSTPVSVSINP